MHVRGSFKNIVFLYTVLSLFEKKSFYVISIDFSWAFSCSPAFLLDRKINYLLRSFPPLYERRLGQYFCIGSGLWVSLQLNR